jgi:hypothetical protein
MNKVSGIGIAVSVGLNLFAMVMNVRLWRTRAATLNFLTSRKDRAMLVEAMTSMKDILEAAINRAVKNKRKPTGK